MKGKGSYRAKYLDKNPAQAGMGHSFIEVSPDMKAIYEAGKVILIDKPLHWTSFDVVKKIRGVLRIKKVGHAGTLDPLASGLLIICTGSFTKKINEYMAREKVYTGEFTLGAVTPTYDLESTPEQIKDITGVTEADLQLTAETFLGHTEQRPPVYSAIKKEGSPLYELARRGTEVIPEPRKIHIADFAITEVDLPRVRFSITCSTGTYIRSVAHDFGQKLGCGAYLSALRRTKIGEFSVDDALTVDAFLELISVKKDS
jgi:tRNA pseudouridine55 synthase